MWEELFRMVLLEPGFYLLLTICTISFFYGVKVTAHYILDDNLLSVLGFQLSLFAAFCLYGIMLNTYADDQLASWLSRSAQAMLAGLIER